MIALRNLRILSKLAAPAILKGSVRAFKPMTVVQQRSLYLQSQFSFSAQQNQREVFTIENEKDFSDKIMNSTKPVVLDFYADWCGPCKKLTPKLVEKYNQSNGDWVFAKSNIDEYEELAKAFEVQSIPTVMLIHKGKIVDHFIGIPPEDRLDKFLKSAEDLAKEK